MSVEAALLVSFLWLLASVGVGVHAMKHDRSPLLWGTLTILTGVIGLVVYIAVVGTQLDDPDRANTVVECPNCAARYADAPNFCSECGEALEQAPESETAHIVRSGANAHCGNCTASVEFDSERCPNCGSLF